MKKFLQSAVCLGLALGALNSAQAHNFEVNKIYYDSIKGTTNCMVTFNQADKTGNKYASYSGDVTVPATVTFDGKTFNVTEIGKYAFRNSAEMTSVKLPESLVKIGNAAFSKCNGLKEVTVPNSVTMIDGMAFNDNPNLVKITLSDKLVEIGSNAFLGVVAMKSITLPKTLEKLQGGAFRNCLALESIDIPAATGLIGNNAFQGCLALKNVNVAADNENYTSVGGVLMSKDKTTLICYPGGRTAAEYTVPEGVTTIGFAAFNQHSISSLYTKEPVTDKYLKTVNLPTSVVTLGNSAFEGLEEMTSFTIPAKVESIGNGTFRGCTKLEKAVIPDATKKIDMYAYGECPALKEVEIGSGMTTIAKKAFNLSAAITRVAVKASVPPTCGADAFAADVTSKAKLQVPKGSLNAYKEAEVWKSFANIEEVDFAGVESVGSDAAEVVAVYNMQGIRTDKLQKGLNIVKMSDGTTRKMIKK